VIGSLISSPLFVPTSIPSPPTAWADIYIPLGWIHGIIPAVAADYRLDIKTYALCLLAGIIVAVIMTSRRLTARGAEPGVVLDIALWCVPLGIIGARVYHVFTHYNDYFGPGKDPITALYIWQGGIAVFGSIIGGAIGVFIACRISGIRFWSFADALAPGLILAQALGRFGNYFNHELYGQPTTLPWGLQIESTNAAYPIGLPAHTLFHPTFLYEILWDLLVLTALLLIERQYKLRWGKLMGLYFIFYGIGRVWFESIRIDPSVVFLGLRTNVWGAIVAIVVGVIIFAVQSRRHPGVEPSVYRPGKEWDPSASKVDLPETYSDTDDGNDAAELSQEEPSTEGASKAAPAKAVAPATKAAPASKKAKSEVAATSGAGV
jgi:prolipoprotein diacylglyceryl transferase